MFFGQRCAAKRRHAVHLGVEHNIYQLLDLRKLLAQQRRDRCSGHCFGEFIESELKSIRQFHIVRARSIERRDNDQAQLRLKFIGSKRRPSRDLAFQLFFKFIQRSAVTVEITLQFPIISLVRKRIELPEPVPLCCHLVECLSCIRPNAPSPVEKCPDKQCANGKANYQDAECPILLKPLHGNHGLHG